MTYYYYYFIIIINKPIRYIMPLVIPRYVSDSGIPHITTPAMCPITGQVPGASRATTGNTHYVTYDDDDAVQ